uniref:Amino acid transporter n=1 Tax=Steinernema glaseri TaxID=37863 RepID=A0A1I7YQX8_9BILA
MNMLKMMILPLIAASLISGLSQLDAKQSGRMSVCAFAYYAATTSLAVLTGIALVLIIHPGDASVKMDKFTPDDSEQSVSAFEKFLDLIRNMFPDNIVQASFQQTQTDYVIKLIADNENTTKEKLDIIARKVDGMNVLGFIVFCIVFGVVIGQIGEKAQVLADFFTALDLVITRIVILIMWYSPVGIASLIAAKILGIANLAETAKMLGIYMLTVIIGLAVHLFVTIPLIYFAISRKNPYKFMQGLLQAALTALGTASSAATLPITFQCLEKNNKVDPRITKFVLPVGATINMDGTALYEAVASVFIAQINGIELSFGQVVTVSLTATLASIGAASIPSAGLVTMLIVLTAVGLPTSDISLIIAVDWLLDRLRTCVNVLGDGFGCGCVHELCRKDLVRAEPPQVPAIVVSGDGSTTAEKHIESF